MLMLGAGVLLVVILAVFLAVGRWKNPFSGRDLPKRLGIDIQQEANGVTYTQSHGGHTIFKIHASKAVQLRNGHITLHDVAIELYGQGGESVDHIAGSEFDYVPKTGIATAAGAVEITLTQPEESAHSRGQSGSIHVKTSGLIFNQHTGIASTNQPVEFSTSQASGSSLGASYDSNQGTLVLDSAVELTTRRGVNPVRIHATYAEFDRSAQTGLLREAAAETNGERASAAVARIGFRGDGSVARLDGSGGVSVLTADSRLAAPRGFIIFNPANQPQNGSFDGGVAMESDDGGRQVKGNARRMTLDFDSGGKLRSAHLAGGVELQSDQAGQTAAQGRVVPVRIVRSWRSLVADVNFRQSVEGRLELAQVHGAGGAVVISETLRGNEPALPSRLAADDVTGVFGPNSTLTTLTGAGHASVQETAANGARMNASSDRFQARFAPAAAKSGGAARTGQISSAKIQSGQIRSTQIQSAQIQSAELDGQVTLVEQPAGRPGVQPQPPVQASAGRAVYEAAGQWLHLTLNPRIAQGGMEMTANRIDLSRTSGDGFAYGNVKATWSGAGARNQSASGGDAISLAEKGPVHAIADEAELDQASGEAVLRGHARLWQQDNSIGAPRIVLNQRKQTLAATTANPAEPVVAVLIDAAPGRGNGRAIANDRAATSSATPSLIRVSGGSLYYSGARRKAVVRAAPLAAVTAQSDGVKSASGALELFLASPGAFKPPAAAGPAAVERMEADGHVVLASEGRRATGAKLVYTARTGQYVLTGTPSAPPRLSDPRHGSVAGAALIFNSRDDSVSIEGNGQATTTETTAPR